MKLKFQDLYHKLGPRRWGVRTGSRDVSGGDNMTGALIPVAGQNSLR